MEHAERNAIYNAALRGTSTLGTHMYITWFPCVDCARAIIQAGVTRLVSPEPDFDARPEWADSWTTAQTLLTTAGVDVTYA